ncbi:MAG: hypothetical protein HDKAJFGB_02358 [Anaerolineae bacterium]|nr:hypothetical protein [Anaerolineae bacterium]
MTETRRVAHHFARRTHFGSETHGRAVEFVEWQHNLFDKKTVNARFLRKSNFAQRFADGDLCGDARERYACGFGDEWHRAARARVHFQHIHNFIFDGELRVHQTAHAEFQREARRVIAQNVEMILRNFERRQNARAVARMNPRFFNVLHDAADDDFAAVAHAIHVHLERIFQIAIN